MLVRLWIDYSGCADSCCKPTTMTARPPSKALGGLFIWEIYIDTTGSSRLRNHPIVSSIGYQERKEDNTLDFHRLVLAPASPVCDMATVRTREAR